MKLLSILFIALLSASVVYGQAATAQRILDAPFSQLLTTVPDGSVRHCINCQKTNPCTASVDGTQAMAEKLNGVWNCAGGGTASSGVNTITGTANQIIANAPSGNITLSTPQDIGTSSNVQFLGLHLGGSLSGFLRFDQSIAPAVSGTSTARLYFDTTSKNLKISQNAGDYKFFATFTSLSTNAIPKLNTSLFTGHLVNSSLSDTGSLVTSTVPVRATGFNLLLGPELSAVATGTLAIKGNAAGTLNQVNYGTTGTNMSLDTGLGAHFTFNATGTTGGTVGARSFLANSSADGGLILQRVDGIVSIKAPDNSGVHYDSWDLILPVVSSGMGGKFLRNITGTGATDWAAVNLASSDAISGTLTVPNGGTGLATIASNTLIKGNGTSAAVVTGITVDSSNNISTAGALKLGVSSSVAGNLALEAGSATSVLANNIQIQAPSSVTNWNMVLPSAAGNGLLLNSNSTNVVTQSFVNAETILSTTASVDLNSATATSLYTCPTGKSCVITRVLIRNASTSLTTASVAFGWESPTFTNVINTATYTALTGSTLYSIANAKAGAKVGTAAEVFKAFATILQGGAATVSIETFGFIF